MQEPEAQAKLKAIFVEPSTLDTAAMGKFIDEQANLWGGAVHSAGISVEQ
jgi:hypothetical protein